MLSESTRDSFYRGVFIFYFFTATFFDSIHLYPRWLVPTPLFEFNQWYIKTFNDRLFMDGGVWFKTFSYIELFYQAPMCLWLYFAIGRKDHRVPAHLLALGTLGLITTIPCITELYYNPNMTTADLMGTLPAYVMFVGIFGTMIIDSMSRINSSLAVTTVVKSKKN